MAKKIEIKEACLVIDGEKSKINLQGMEELMNGDITEDDIRGGYGNKEKIEELRNNRTIGYFYSEIKKEEN